MSGEGQNLERKSLRVLEHPAELAKGCVAFANARGGLLLIGIEDGETEPPQGQRVRDAEIDQLRKRMSQLTVNVGTDARRAVAGNGGEYIELQVFASVQSIAATSDGRYYIRVADESHPLMPDELSRLMSDKTAFSWESHRAGKTLADKVDAEKQATFLGKIRDSGRISDFMRNKTDGELLDYYHMTREGYLTNLGVLWVGRRSDRATLRYTPVIQCIKYDESGKKIDKILWDDHALNPLELIESVWREVPDWRQTYEFPDGLYRTEVHHFDEVVVRELLANALVHRPYTQAGDIFINLHPDRLEVHNPGLLPLGVTPGNILHTTVKRNELLAKVFYDLGLMEREGSGYDRIYEVLLGSGRPVPIVREGNDRVAVTVERRVVNPAVLDFMARADQAFELSQRERILLGMLAQRESLSATELCRGLELGHAAELRPWLGRLPDWGLVRKRGRTKGLHYMVNPELLRDLRFKGSTSLKGIEEHRLRELVLHDLGIYREASSTEIQTRIGPEIPLERIRRQLEVLMSEGLVERTGQRRWTRYVLKEA